MLRISELRNKDVIDMRDGKRLGNIADIDMNVDSGRIEALVIPEGGRLLSLRGRAEETVIGWRQIRRIGLDVILVDPDNSLPPRSAFDRGLGEDAFTTGLYQAGQEGFDL